jgi:hypothetical protein
MMIIPGETGRVTRGSGCIKQQWPTVERGADLGTVIIAQRGTCVKMRSLKAACGVAMATP